MVLFGRSDRNPDAPRHIQTVTGAHDDALRQECLVGDAGLAGHFDRLLEAIVKNPQKKISDLPLLTAAEQHQLLVERNATARPYATDRCVHQLFEDQVDRTPDAVAVEVEGPPLVRRLAAVWRADHQPLEPEAARLLSWPVGTVSGRLSRGRLTRSSGTGERPSG